MAKPFALAPNGGGYLIFLFLLLPIPLLYSQLHLVDLGDDFDALTMMTVTVTIDRSIDVAGASGSNVNDTRRRRRQWDPGITKHSNNGRSSSITSCRRPTSSRNSGEVVPSSKIPTMTPSFAPATNDVFYTRRMAAATRVRRVWDPGIRAAVIGVPADSNVVVVTMARTDMQLPVASSYMTLANRLHRVFLLTSSALATVKSIFHYSHPVLSRPTVPNINVFHLPV